MDQHTDLIAMSEALGTALQQHSYLLALAESCTGGLAAAAITDIAGSSAWFDRGFVTYSNAAKQDMLAVSAETLDKHGAVSEETAIAMALGALEHSQADIAASITGIAGPTGGTSSKPAGTVCFAWASKDGWQLATTEFFAGNRLTIRHQAVIHLMTGLINALKKT